MGKVARSVLAVVAGLAAGAVLIGALEAVGHHVYPPPAGVHGSDPEAFAAAIRAMPTGAFLFVLLAWVVGTFGGAWVAAKLATRAGAAHGYVVGAFFLLAGLTHLVMIPHPGWFVALSVLLLPAAAYLAGLASASTTRPSPPTTSAIGA